MTGSGGLKIGLKQLSPLLDTVVGLKDGSVRLQSNADLSTQLMSSGPLANLLATTSGNVVFFATKEIMDAATDYTAPQAAWVFADDDPGNNGAYYFTNGDPGFWTFMLNFPNSWVYATVSGGDANAIELSMPASASQSTMIFFEVQDDNLAGGVTIAINGGDPLTALDFRGDALEAGALAEGALAVFFPVGDGTARMIIDNTAEAAAAAAAASAASANTSALASSDSAVDAAASALSAQRFADAPEDEETSAGSGLYSAYHWSQKALEVVLGAIGDQIAAATAAAPAGADIFPFVEDATGDLKKIILTDLITTIKTNGDLATKSGAETLTNKTLTTPLLTLQHSAGFLQTAAGRTGFDDTSKKLVIGDGANARFFSPDDATGKWEFIRKIVFAGDLLANVTDLSAYEFIRIWGWCQATVADSLGVRFSSDNGANYAAASGNYYNIVDGTANGSPVSSQSLVDTYLRLNYDQNRGGAYPNSFSCRIDGFNKAQTKPFKGWADGVNSSPADYEYNTGGRINVATTFNALRLIAASGNGITTGTVYIEGVRG